MLQGVADLKLHNKQLLDNISEQVIAQLDAKRAKNNDYSEQNSSAEIMCASDVAIMKEIMHAYKSVKYTNSKLAESVSMWLISNLTNMQDEDFSVFLSFIAKFGLQRKEVAEKLGEHAIILISQFNVQQIAQVVWALATLGLKNQEFYIQSVNRVMGQFLDPQASRNYNQKDIIQLLVGYAKADYYDVGLFNDFAHQITKKIIYNMDGQDLSNTFWAYSKLNYKDKNLFKLLAKQVIRNLDKIDAHQQINIFWAIANIQFKDSHLILQLIQQLYPQIQKLKGQELVDLAWALSVLKQNQKSLLNKIAKYSGKQLNKLDIQQRGKLAWAFSNLNYFNEDYLEHVAHQAHVDIQNQNPEYLANTMQTLAILQYYDLDLIQQIIQKAYSQLHKFNPYQLTQFIYGFVIFNHYDRQLFEQIQNQLINQFNKFKGGQLINILWSFAAIKNWDINLWQKIGEQLNNILIQTEFQEQDLLRLMHIINMAKADDKNLNIQALNLHDSILLKVQEAWRTQLKDKNQVTEAQLSVFRILKYLGYDPQLEHKIDEFQIVVDIFLELDGRQIAVEFDGPQHFTRNKPYKKVIKTLIRDRVLKAAGLEVLSIPFYDWEKKPDKSKKMSYLKKLLGK
eukprot:TRINITY_DN5667_c0_g1_i1.p1 TRINITY_DN5667_c0_g1~~TRINITY_DN5667_c0_g1_i1.p1  ORF type:complete len:648 (+),score=63.40 TRINITY_DN5667_c0_g1_i1:77-1945(+)